MLLQLAGFFNNIELPPSHIMISLCEVRLLKVSSENAPADG